MLNKSILTLLKMLFKEQYYSKLFIIYELAANIVTVLIYFYTSKAFSPRLQENLSFYQEDYFSYMIIGEVALAIPLYFFSGVYAQARKLIAEGVFETLLVLRTNTRRILIQLSIAGAYRELYRVLLTLIIASIFGMEISIGTTIKMIVLVVSYSPIFIMLGLIGVSTLLIFKRGQGLVGSMSTFLSILAGSYFPVEVFPEIVQKISSIGSPFTGLLLASRKIMGGALAKEELMSTIISIGFWTFFLIPLAVFFYEYAIKKQYKNGPPIGIREY